MKKLEKIDGSNFLWNLYMKTEVMSFTMSKNFIIFNDLKIGLVCSVKDEKVIMLFPVQFREILYIHFSS